MNDLYNFDFMYCGFFSCVTVTAISYTTKNNLTLATIDFVDGRKSQITIDFAQSNFGKFLLKELASKC